MYRLPTVSRSGRGLSAPPSRTRSRSASPSRNISQYAHSVKQAPIIPRYRPGGDMYTVPAYLASHYNSPIIPTSPVSPMMTPTATSIPTSPMKPTISPKMKPTVSPKFGAPKMVITPVMSPKMTGVSPKRSPSPMPRSPSPMPMMPTTVYPYPLSHYTDIITPTTAPTTVHPAYPLSHYTDIITPTTAPTTTHPAYPLSHYTDIPVPSPITAPNTVHTPFPLPHYTDVAVPSPITAPTSIHTPFPLPHYTGFPVPSPITAPMGLPRPPYPLSHYTDIPIPSPINPSGYRTPNPTSAPGMPWWIAAIGMGVGLGMAIVIAKERGETVILPTKSIPSISIPEAALITMSTSETGMGTESVLESVLASLSNKVSTSIVPPVKSFLHILFSWVGMCGTFVFFCFVAVIKAKLFASVAGTSSTGSSTGSTGTVSFADGPTYIPPLDLATARISLDLSAKTYVEQLIAYYETLADATDRMSLSQRKLADGFETSKVHVD